MARLTRRVGGMSCAGMVAAVAGVAPGASAQIGSWEETPPIMLQWFETPWQDMERRMPDWFVAGYGAVWLPPVSRGYVPPTNSNQNSDSAGYDVFDRFHLGKPNARTAYGTESGFGAVVSEFHLANGLVYIDCVMNHNAGRQTGAGFQGDGGYPGFWMAPAVPPVNKTPTSAWGDFHAGISTGYYQSENPGNARYCLHAGDLLSLIDIDHATNNMFIRQPVQAGNAQNIPGGTYFNTVDAGNARFYTDAALGNEVVNNPGMSVASAGSMTGSPFGPFPCDVPARNEPASNLTLGRFNAGNPMAGDAYLENASGYLMRWAQWMLDVHKVDGFRIDAIKHMPSWWYDTYFDAVVYNRRTTPDGRLVTPYSFGESVEGNDFTFDRYIRKANGRASGRTGDWFGNRDALDLNGAGATRDLINGFNSWSGVQGAYLDGTDDGFNNGSIGVNHIFSHDNGSVGNGSSQPALPTHRQQGWFAHAYLVMRTGQAKIYHNGRGIVARLVGSGFWPREGVPVALGLDPSNNTANTVVTGLVQLSNMLGRGEYLPRWTDDFVQIFERRTPTGGGAYSGNCLVGCNRSYAGLGITSYDQRTFNTHFPQGTRLIEMTGNAARADVDPSAQIDEVITVGAGGSVTIRVPRNQNINGVDHHRGFVVYAPAIPGGTLALTNVASTIAPDPVTTAAVRRRLTPLPVISDPTFEVQLTTVNGDAGAANNDNADDNAVFRLNQGFTDSNHNGGVDKAHTDPYVPGYEDFLTQKTPLANTGNTNGIYRQVVTTSDLPEGVNYLSVVAFRKRGASDAALYREWRQAFYVDRLCPTYTFVPPATIPTTTSATVGFTGVDRTAGRFQVWVNPPAIQNIVQQALNNPTLNAAPRVDRFEWTRVVTGLGHGNNTIAVVVVEDSGRACRTDFTVFADLCVADMDDGSGTGTADGGVDISDLLYFLQLFDLGDLGADVDDGSGTGTPDGGVDISDLLYFLARFDAGC